VNVKEREMMKKYIIPLVIWTMLLPALNGQATYEHITNRDIYTLLDELASEKVISLNAAIKPYTRAYICKKLNEASVLLNDTAETQFSTYLRLKTETKYYLDYYTFGNQPNYTPSKDLVNLFKKSEHSATSLNHLGYYYSDSLFSFALRPILGLEYYSNSSGTYQHTCRGLEAFASLTKYLSFYASLRDNTVSERLMRPGYFSTEPAANYKESNASGSSDYSEMRGGVMLSWDFLEVGIVKDHMTWSNNYNGAIIQSGLTPSIPMIKLHVHPVKWFDFNYFHAWLVSDVVDSTLSYVLPDGTHRDTYKNKFMAANMFTIIPVKGLNLSFGNSIIYSDQNVNLAYLIPIFFYKSVDHTLTSTKIVNQNSQMFFDVSTRLIRHTHFFFTLFVDEFSTRRISDPETHNLYSYKLGGRISNWPVKNLSITGEYFKSIPIVYKHIVPTATYETSSYNMGPWLKDNSEEKYFSLEWHPLPRFYSRYAYSNARHGNEYAYVDGKLGDRYPILQDNTWTDVTHSLFCSYEVLTGCYLSLEYLISNIQGYDVDGHTAQYYLDKFTPEFFQGKKNTVMVRINIGF
jgi:hypothetical protein